MYTPEMTQAERELDGRIDHALRTAGKLRERLAEHERKAAATPPTDEDVERVKAFVLGHAYTEQWRPVLDRIDRGELTWRAVVEGLACGRADRELATAFEALRSTPPPSVEKLVELGIFPAQLPEDPPAEPVREEEDAFFDNPLRLRRH